MHHTERLLLHNTRPEDFDRYVEIHTDPQTNLFNPAGPMKPEDGAKAFKKFTDHWAQYKFGTWTIRLKENNHIIGFGGLSFRMYGDELKLNVGYRLAPEAWGKGYATEITDYAIRFGFEELKAAKIFAIVRPAHAVSIKVLEKCGMKKAGTLDDVPGEAESLVYVIEPTVADMASEK